MWMDEEKREFLNKIIRVDHAGEFGAVKIYEGQLAVLKDSPYGQKIEAMKDQEVEHLNTFNKLIRERRIRPTALSPIWGIGAYAMGFGTALLGKEAAMACTEAVEDVISKHYNDQLREVLQSNPDDEQLRQILKQFRDDEQEHQETAIQHNSRDAPMYNILYPSIKFITETAVWVATKI
uniref:5-demethoxyubiquinone hydroxylase, mitochondrial n=1 Tax=Arcella intermedia TaxID=1963864 RepID=A0A6B2LIV3_9EUKA